ncbi:MAG: glycosyltransferase [Chitinophagaceae bacterium]|jgi:glycosyltransferase involved in cell wall biosynthesis
MGKKLRIVCTVTNDLNYDQRMIRICSALANDGHDVTLVGFKKKSSKPLVERPFRQKRIPIIAEKGKLLYIDYWIKLFFVLLFRKADVLCAIDLDTIMPVYYASKIRGKQRVYDAHELFTELKEVISRPAVHKMWLWIEQHTVPNFPVGYTIGECYAAEFKRKYGVDYGVVRNATILKPLTIPEKKEKYILYQGAVNVGRRFEQLIPAMQYIDAPLIICGEGNYFEETKALVAKYKLEDKVTFKGYLPPEELRQYTLSAYIGITLFEDTSLSNKLSMANRFFDYMHSAVPQICNQYPEYVKVNAQFEIAALLDDPNPENIAAAINNLLNDEAYHKRLEQNCLAAREIYCWQMQEKTLLNTYAQFR